MSVSNRRKFDRGRSAQCFMHTARFVGVCDPLKHSSCGHEIEVISRTDVLERKGIPVTIASYGEEASQDFEHDRHRIALPIKELVIPVMSGYDLAVLRDTHSALQIVFISGSSGQLPTDGDTPCTPKRLDLPSLALQDQEQLKCQPASPQCRIIRAQTNLGNGGF